MSKRPWLDRDKWKGSHKNEDRPGEFYTNTELSQKVAEIAESYRCDGFYEIGVGEGAIFSRLSEPKSGIELSHHTEQKFSNVTYGEDVFTSVQSNTNVTVIMNPPFNKYREFFNYASAFAKYIIWIVGPNVRLWTNEDSLDRSMHLVKEWIVPGEMSHFTNSVSGQTKRIKSIVQVWRKADSPRELWNLKSCLKGVSKQEKGNSGYMIKKVGMLKDVGKYLKINGNETQEEMKKIGTLREKHGTALLIHDDPLLKELDNRLSEGIITDLMRHRTTPLVSLSLIILSNILSGDWERLKRPIEYLDEKKREDNQW